MKIKLGKIKTVFKGTVFEIKQRPVIYPDGSPGLYEYCQRPASVTILAFNDQDELLMLREYRHNYGRKVWFLPCGRVDKKGETPRSAAQRELREEGGYRAKKLRLLTHKKSPSNVMIWDVFVYLASGLVFDPLPLDRGEIIETKFVPFSQAVAMAKDGRIENEYIAYHIIRLDYERRSKK
ncbi:MAG TPA: NUDIX hydrolase [Patescibacteria group bacterium]|nr:NUDIX hydrolase [Patescibacteria group bacterium]